MQREGQDLHWEFNTSGALIPYFYFSLQSAPSKLFAAFDESISLAPVCFAAQSEHDVLAP
jgi:hypothetical protein